MKFLLVLSYVVLTVMCVLYLITGIGLFVTTGAIPGTILFFWLYFDYLLDQLAAYAALNVK